MTEIKKMSRSGCFGFSKEILIMPKIKMGHIWAQNQHFWPFPQSFSLDVSEPVPNDCH